MGWTAAESGCFGLMQVVPACGGATNKPCLLPSGHPDMSTDATSSDYAGSVFNPSVNIEIGIGGFADNRAQIVKQFPGCTEEQYTLMALGNYANYGSTKSCTVYDTSYTSLVLSTYHTYAMARAIPPTTIRDSCLQTVAVNAPESLPTRSGCRLRCSFHREAALRWRPRFHLRLRAR